MSVKIGGVSTLDEMELKVLKFQHEKLKQRFESRKKGENDLKLKIEQLEKRKMEDDAVINIVNRHWNQLDEDIRIILQRFDGVTSNDLEIESDLEGTSFLSSERNELDGRLKNRVVVSKRAVVKIVNAFDHLKMRNEKLVRLMKAGISADPSEDKITIKSCYIEIQEENNRLHTLNTTLHEKCHYLSLKVKELNDRVIMSETKADEIKNDLEEMQWDKCKLQMRYDKLVAKNTEQEQNFRRLEANYARDAKTESTNGNQKKVDLMDSEQYMKLQKELEDVKEMSSNRLEELEKLHIAHKEALKDVDMWRKKAQELPESMVVENPAYKCLQSKFSVIFNNTNLVVARFEEFKKMFANLKTQHLKDIDRMEREELALQIKMRTEILTIEDALDEAQRLYEHSSFTAARNSAENTVLIDLNKEMKILLTSCHNNNKRLKEDVGRYRKKYNELKKRRSDKNNFQLNGCNENVDSPTSSCHATDAGNGLPSLKRSASEYIPSGELPLDPKRRKTSAATEVAIKEEVLETSDTGYPIKQEKWDQQQRKEKVKKRQSYDSKLDVQVPPGEDTARLIEELEKDMDVTGQAYEEMLEQNNRLICEVVQKDRENLRLIEENLKLHQVKTLVKNQNELLNKKLDLLTTQILQQKDVARLQNEKETYLTQEVSFYEKESQLRQSAFDCQRRKLVESVQVATDLKIHLEKYQSQMRDAQETIIEKTSSLESEKYKIKRLQEEISFQKKTVERLEKIERTGSKDMVLLEEIREYKELLTCNACQVRRKNAVLTKCFHVFCFDCLRTCYDTRQRKCPKCNAAFGAKDYHRLFLT